MIDEQTAIEKGQCCPLVSKCLRAVESGNPAAVTKSDYESALDSMAKNYAEDSGLDHATAYCEVLETEVGRALYSGLVGVPQTGRVNKAAGGGEAWAEIREAARQLQDVDGTVTLEEAVEKVLAADPQLYSQYLAEQA